MGNIWGFPSYALREAAAAKGLKAKLSPLLNVLVEPIGADYYTPRAGQVYESVAREVNRIDWASMTAKGVVRMVRPRHGGGYFSVLTPPPRHPAPGRFGPDQAGRVPLQSRSPLRRLSRGEVPLRPPAVPPDPQRLQPRRERLRTPRLCLRGTAAATEHGDGPGQWHRGLPASSSASWRTGRSTGPRPRSCTCSATMSTAPRATRPPSAAGARTGSPTRASTSPRRPGAVSSSSSWRSWRGQERADLIGLMGGTNTPYRRAWENLIDRGRKEG